MLCDDFLRVMRKKRVSAILRYSAESCLSSSERRFVPAFAEPLNILRAGNEARSIEQAEESQSERGDLCGNL